MVMVKKRREEEIIINPEGNLDTKKAERLESRILEIINEGSYNLVIDFTYVQTIDISGLSMMLMVVNELLKRGRRLKVRNVLSPVVRDMLKSIYLEDLVQFE